MIFLKISGAILVALAVAMWTAEKNSALKEETKVLDSILRLAVHIRREIDCFSTPLPDILASFSDETLEKYDFFPAFFSDPSAAAKSLPIDRESAEEVGRFLSSLGHGFTEGEVKLCDLYIEKFTALADRAKAEYPRRAKVQSSLAFLVGACAVILLI